MVWGEGVIAGSGMDWTKLSTQALADSTKKAGIVWDLSNFSVDTGFTMGVFLFLHGIFEDLSISVLRLPFCDGLAFTREVAKTNVWQQWHEGYLCTACKGQTVGMELCTERQRDRKDYPESTLSWQCFSLKCPFLIFSCTSSWIFSSLLLLIFPISPLYSFLFSFPYWFVLYGYLL